MSNREQKRFKTFLSSVEDPRNAIRLLPLLIKWLQEADAAEISSESVFEQLWPEKQYSAQRLRESVSHLYRLLKRFLTVEEYGRHAIDLELKFLSQLRKRKLFKEFEKAKKALLKVLDNHEFRDLQWYEWQAKLADESDQCFVGQHRRGFDENLASKAYYIDISYMGLRLRTSCELKNRMDIIGTGYDTEEIFAVLELLEAKREQYLEIPLIRIYHAILQMQLYEDTPEYFANLKRILQEDSRNFPSPEARGMYKYAQNYCIKKMNQGKAGYAQELLSLYKSLLQRDLILIAETISPNDYKNIITVGLRSGDTDWVREFLQEYRDHLPKHARDNAYNYNLASFYYETQDYNNAIELLNTVRFTDVYYQVSTRFILAKTYFETSEFYSLSYFVTAFKLFLRRNKAISATNKQANLNCLIALSRLSKLKESSGLQSREKIGKELDKLLQYINSGKPISNKRWLLKQMNLLSGS